MLIMTLYSMFFFHVLDDFHLQGILASMKQKAWWQKNAPQPLYRHDYKAALIIHSISWAMLIMAPICWAYVDDVNPLMYTAALIINAAVHAFVDDQKANKHTISLIANQAVHAVQIILTWIIFSI